MTFLKYHLFSHAGLQWISEGDFYLFYLWGNNWKKQIQD